MKRLALLFALFALSTAVAHADDTAVPPYSPLAASTTGPMIIPVPPGADRAAQIQQMWDEGHKREAEKEATKWLKTDEKSPWPWIAEAGLNYRAKNWGKSFSMANAALKRDPNLADGFYWRGRYYERKKKPLDAANEYRAAVEAQASHEPAKEGLARLRTQLGETDDAAQPN